MKGSFKNIVIRRGLVVETVRSNLANDLQ